MVSPCKYLLLLMNVIRVKSDLFSSYFNRVKTSANWQWLTGNIFLVNILPWWIWLFYLLLRFWVLENFQIMTYFGITSNIFELSEFAYALVTRQLVVNILVKFYENFFEKSMELISLKFFYQRKQNNFHLHMILSIDIWLAQN